MHKITGRQKKEHAENILFTLPALLLVSIMMYVPFLMSGYYSLTEWNGIAKTPVFVGLANFKKLFANNSIFSGTILFTLRYTLFFMLASNVVALILAVALTRKFRLANVFRGLFFIMIQISVCKDTESRT